MIIDNIKELPLEEIQDIYCCYLKTQNLSLSKIRTSCYDAFYLHKYDNTIDFWYLLESPNFEKLAYEHLYSTLSIYSKGNVKTKIPRYMSHLTQFRNFIYSDLIMDMESVKLNYISTTQSKITTNPIQSYTSTSYVD